MTETQWNILFGVAIAALLVLNIYVRKLQTERSPIGRAVLILKDLSRNQKLMENFAPNWQTPPLPMRSWKKNKRKVDFLPQQIRDDLANAFGMIGEINGKIDEARKNKSDSYVAQVNLDRTRPMVNKARQEIFAWVQENMHNRAYYPKRKGLTDLFRWRR